MIEWLLKLAGSPTGGLDPSAPGVRLQFDHELSPTVWVIVLLAAAGVALLSYVRLQAPTWARLVGAALRAAVIALVALLLTGPKLVQISERIEKDWALALVDRSASLTVADVSDPSGAVVSREQQLATLLREGQSGLSKVASQRTLTWLGFDAGTYDLAVTPESTPRLDPPTGRATDIAGAIEAALARASARPISGIVLFSDGRATSPVPPALIRRLSAEKIGLYPVALGSSLPSGDASIESVDAPVAAFAGDAVPVAVKLRWTGSPRGENAAPLRVELVDEATGKVIDEAAATPDPITTQPGSPARGPGADQLEQTMSVSLTGTPEAGGPAQRRWRVRVVPVAGELVQTNNDRSLAISMVERPLRLMYVDGYPRWEYRFLKNVLSRERSLSFAATLLAPGRRFISEGAEEVFVLPATQAQWDGYDVIMLGDVQANVFTPEQLAQIRTRVAVGGAGLIWIAGDGAVPQAFAGTPLADLLPITLRGESVPTWDQDVVMRPTLLADRLGVMRLSARQPNGTFWPTEAGDPASGWSRLRWAQRLSRDRLKPAVEVLAQAHPAEGEGTQPPTPLVVTMRYGAGRVIYIATDELWRYRYGKGEQLVERFYLQLVRLLGRESVSRSGRPAVMQITPARAEVGQAVRVSVELVDQSLAESASPTLMARLRRSAGVATDPAAQTDLTLRLDVADGRKTYVGTWAPAQPGQYQAVAIGSLLDGKDVTAEAEVFAPTDELRRPESDHANLALLAEQTGGRVLDGRGLAQLNDILPRREVRIVTPGREQTLWDRPLWLVVIVLLLGGEWVLRRLVRLT